MDGFEERSWDFSKGWKYTGQVERKVNLNFGGLPRTCEAV